MATIPTSHVREHTSLLMASEKRLLVWMAERLPAQVNSDHLTALGLAGMLLAGLAFWAARWHEGALLVVVLGLALNWLPIQPHALHPSVAKYCP